MIIWPNYQGDSGNIRIPAGVCFFINSNEKKSLTHGRPPSLYVTAFQICSKDDQYFSIIRVSAADGLHLFNVCEYFRDWYWTILILHEVKIIPQSSPDWMGRRASFKVIEVWGWAEDFQTWNSDECWLDPVIDCLLLTAHTQNTHTQKNKQTHAPHTSTSICLWGLSSIWRIQQPLTGTVASQVPPNHNPYPNPILNPNLN